MKDIEELKNAIEDFEIQDLAKIIREEPLIAGISSTLSYNKKQREELKSCMLDIAKRVLDLSELKGKFLLENMNIETDKRIYNILKELF